MTDNEPIKCQDARYLLKNDVDIEQLLVCGPGALISCDPDSIHLASPSRIWYEPIEDEL